MSINSQKEKAERLHALHHTGQLLILPNIWDPLSALLLEELGYPAIATASASIAFTNGYPDGEYIPFDDLVRILTRISSSVDLPVTADIESGYSDNVDGLRENIKKLVGAGIVGVNIEDTNAKTKQLYTIEGQCNRIKTIRSVADETGIPLFINARTDIYLHEKEYRDPAEQLNAVIERGLAYKQAGADGFYPILLKGEEEIKKVIAVVELPLNILTFPGIPDLPILSKVGVARVSLGPSFLKIAIQSMKQLAIELGEMNGLSTITGNKVTTDDLRNLVSKAP